MSPHTRDQLQSLFVMAFCASFIGGALGCGDEAAPEEEVIEPMQRKARFLDGPDSAQLGGEQNQVTCYTCHTGDGSQFGFCGNTLKDLGYRESWMGGGADSLMGASNKCIEGWMAGDALDEGSEPYEAIQAYIMDGSDPAVTTPNAIMPEVLADLDAYEAIYVDGNAEAGLDRYVRYCSLCHGVGLVVGAHAAPDLSEFATMTAGEIARQVRTSGPPPSAMDAEVDETPGPMPFFEEKDLSTEDLRNIIAYMQSQQ